MAAARRRKQARHNHSDGNGPTHYLKMKTTARDGAGWSRVGAAWVKPGGETFSIKLNRGVVLDWHDFAVEDAEFVLILVPAD